MHVWRLCETANTKGYRYLLSVLETGDHIRADMEARNNTLLTADRTKSKTYVLMNPTLKADHVFQNR